MTTARRSVAEWEEIFREHEASGESVATFCIRRGISMSPFYRYRRRLRAAPGVSDPSQPAFVPVAVTPRAVPAPITLTIGRVSMALSSSVPPAWVAALLAALKA